MRKSRVLDTNIFNKASLKVENLYLPEQYFKNFKTPLFVPIIIILGAFYTIKNEIEKQREKRNKKTDTNFGAGLS